MRAVTKARALASATVLLLAWTIADQPPRLPPDQTSPALRERRLETPTPARPGASNCYSCVDIPQELNADDAP